MWTEMQTQIITRTAGDTVVVASPGSGKTTVLTQHIVHQLKSGQVDPRDVMLITYTRQAALEMKQRLYRTEDLNVRTLEALRIGTFHAQAFHMLLQLGVKVPPLLGSHQQHELLRTILTEEGLADPVHVAAITLALTKSKSSWPASKLQRTYRRAARRYEQAKQRLARWDYDDILLTYCRSMEASKAVVPAVKYLLVDEFQDTNQIQWEIVSGFRKLWDCRLFVVGDDDQSIYAFRGGSPIWLERASKEFQGTETYLLTRNFRSDIRVIEHATNLIVHNQHRLDKPFETHSEAFGWCGFAEWRNETEEALAVYHLLLRLAAARPSWEIAVLARTRRQLLPSFSLCKAQTHRQRITWQTFHSAKGKEFDAVIIVGAVADNPYLRELADDEEEERRLFYVAMTRARHGLWVSCPTRTEHGRARPTPFISETRIRKVSGADWQEDFH